MGPNRKSQSIAVANRVGPVVGSRLSSIMALESSATGLREAVIRVKTINSGASGKALEAEGYVVRDTGRG
jgi:hypothetical protein